jgi:hypothetical protein
VQINEFHYDNINVDVNQFIEFRHTEPLTGYEVILYNGYNGLFYNRTDLSDIPTTTTTPLYRYTVVPFGQIANAVEGIALKAPNGTVTEFISYEGKFTAKNGPAKGMTSVDILVSESNICTSVGMSLQKCANNGLWIGPKTATPGKLNRNCTTLPSATKAPAPCGKVVPSPVAVPVKAPVAVPVKAPAATPVKTPVARPVMPPMVTPPTKSDPAPVTAPVVAPPVTAPVTSPQASPVMTPNVTAAPVTAPVLPPAPTRPDTPTSKPPEKCGLFKMGIFCPFECGYVKRQLKLC